jgi:hypothetical protein
MNVCMRFSLLVLCAAALAGCGKKETGPSCRQIVTYMMRIREFGTFDERGAIEECRRQKWSASQRRCLYGAKSLDAMAKCVPAVKGGAARPAKLPLPEWHPRTDLPIETGPERLERERLEREKLEREGKGSAAPTESSAPTTPTPPAPAATPGAAAPGAATPSAPAATPSAPAKPM